MSKRAPADLESYRDRKGSQVYGMSHWTLSPEQKELSEIIDCSDMVMVSGKAGTGKTAAVLHNYAKTYLNDKTKKIIIIRTPVEAGMDKIGALPGSEEEKIGPHFSSAKRILETLLSKEKVKCDTGKRIHFVIPNFVLGETFDDSLIIISEAQQMSPEMLKLLLERTGKNSKVVIEGDESQRYTSTGKRAGLSKMVEIFNKNPQSGIEYFEFSKYNNMRSDFVGKINQVFESTDLI